MPQKGIRVEATKIKVKMWAIKNLASLIIVDTSKICLGNVLSSF